MRDFSFCYDTYQNLEEPDVYLANPNKKYLSDGAIRTFNLETELYFNNISSISFHCYYMRNGIVNRDYNDIIEGNFLLVRNIGWFQITETQEEGTGINKKKEVRALSLENEFCHKYLTSFGAMGNKEDWDGGLDMYYLWNETLPRQSILHIVMDKLPAWKVGYIDPTITTEPRSFTEDRVDAYSFLTGKISESFDCLFLFDTFDMKVNVYNPSNIGVLSNFYFSYHNVIKKLNKDIDLGQIKTVLYVQGGEYGSSTLDIAELNPSGNNYVRNFDYFKPRMSIALQNGLDAFDVEYKKRQELYQKYLVTDENSLDNLYEELDELKNRVPIFDVKDYNERLIKLDDEINNEANETQKAKLRQDYLNLVNEKIKLLEKQDAYIGTEWDLYGSIELETMYKAYNGVLALFVGKKDTISLQMYNDTYEILYGEDGIVKNQEKRKNEIKTCEDKIKEVKNKLKEISLDIADFLGKELYEELSHFVFEDVFTDTTFVATSTMTDTERLEAERELYNQALKELAKVSKPNPTFTMDSMNFAAIKKFISLTENLKLGDFAIVELEENTEEYPSETVEVRLLKIKINWTSNDFELTFSSATSLTDDEWLFTELRDQAQSTANSLDLNGKGWNYASHQSSFVRDFMTNPLNTALNRLMSSDKEEVTIDNSGIHCREYNANTGTYSDEQLWITRNLICFSNDAFRTVCTALGKVEVNGKELYGLVAQYVYGSLIAGQNLIISNDKGSFTVNGEGVSIKKLDLEIENDYYKIQLGNMNNSEDDDIFTIWKKEGSSWVKQLFFNDGDLTITGKFNSLAGSQFGNWVIGTDSIYYKYNQFGNPNGMYFGVDGLSIGDKFKVDKYGNMDTVNGYYSGEISTNKGNIGGWEITSSGLTGNGTITGGAINGSTITAINSKFTNSTLDSCYVRGDLIAEDASITVTSSTTGNQMRLSEGKLTTNGTIGIYNNDIYCRMLYVEATETGLDKTGDDNAISIKEYINNRIDAKIAELGL